MIAKKNYVVNDGYRLVCCYNEIRRIFCPFPAMVSISYFIAADYVRIR